MGQHSNYKSPSVNKIEVKRHIACLDYLWVLPIAVAMQRLHLGYDEGLGFGWRVVGQVRRYVLRTQTLHSSVYKRRYVNLKET